MIAVLPTDGRSQTKKAPRLAWSRCRRMTARRTHFCLLVLRNLNEKSAFWAACPLCICVSFRCHLCPGDKGGYIPYRDSKLTRLLQPSLGGNAKITIICTVTGALLSSDETHNTLKFANRAKRMKNHAAINEVSNEKVGVWGMLSCSRVQLLREPACAWPWLGLGVA